jgi:hypothetical protein
MVNLTRQDVQNIVDNSRNRLLERVVIRQDFQAQTEVIKAMLTTLQQCQQLVRQSEYQRVQMMRHTASLESRIAQMDQEIRLLRATVDRLIERQPERIIMPVQTPEAAQQTTDQRYLYNPA